MSNPTGDALNGNNNEDKFITLNRRSLIGIIQGFRTALDISYRRTYAKDNEKRKLQDMLIADGAIRAAIDEAEKFIALYGIR